MQSIHRGGVSKDTLDTFWLSKRKHKQFSNNKVGLRALIRWVREAEVSLVVFEATGVYHRLLEASLAVHDFPFVRVNPRQARRFAEGTGTLAKTDRVPSQRCKHRLPGDGCRDVGQDGVSSGIAGRQAKKRNASQSQRDGNRPTGSPSHACKHALPGSGSRIGRPQGRG